MEAGRRETITVQELAVLGEALGIPPVMLMFDIEDADPVRVLPNGRAGGYQGVEWYSGDNVFPTEGADETDWFREAGRRVNRLTLPPDSMDDAPVKAERADTLVGLRWLKRIGQQLALTRDSLTNSEKDLKALESEPEGAFDVQGRIIPRSLTIAAARMAVNSHREMVKHLQAEYINAIAQLIAAGIQVPPIFASLLPSASADQAQTEPSNG
jgi:hypothetical protein